MSVAEWRGGFPAVYRGTALGTTPIHLRVADHLRKLDPEAQQGRYSPTTSKWMRIQNHDTNSALRIYFFESHATNGEHYVLVAAKALGDATWWEGPAEIQEMWVAADSGTVDAFDITWFVRRG